MSPKGMNLRRHHAPTLIRAHLFCRECGVGAFSRGETPEGAEMIAINVRCLGGVDVAALRTTPFDGKNF